MAKYHWNGSWDWDEVSAPLLIDVPRDGRTIKSLVHPARNGYLWLLEREANAINFVDANPYVDQNVFASIDPVTGRPTYDQERKPGTGKPATFCPSLWGGKDWPPAAYSPQTGYLYIPANENLCSTLVGREVEYRPGAGYTGATAQTFVAALVEFLVPIPPKGIEAEVAGQVGSSLVLVDFALRNHAASPKIRTIEPRATPTTSGSVVSLR